MDKQTLKRRAEMGDRIKDDLARRGLSNPDLDGMDRVADIRDGTIYEWVWTVLLTDRRESLKYVMQNAEEAPLVCNGAVVKPWVPEN
jgi:hypothetical protein